MSKQQLTVFENEQFGEVRTVMIDGNPWFVAADVCRALEIVNPSMTLERLDDDEKGSLNLTEGTSPKGGNPNVNIINEPGLYVLVLGSRKPEAKAFRRWVTHEVIPSIRKTGSYSRVETNQDLQTAFQNPEFKQQYIDIMTIRLIAEDLQLDNTAKLVMYRNLNKTKGYSTEFLPAYGGTDSDAVFSATELLKRNGCAMGVIEFNKKMVEAGYLEIKSRPSSKTDENGNAVQKKYKCLTEKGKKYGRNDVSVYNTKETQPLYFEKSFMELYAEIEKEVG